MTDDLLIDAKSALASALADAATEMPDRAAQIAAFLIAALGDEGRALVDYALAIRRRQLSGRARRDLVDALRAIALDEQRKLQSLGLFGSRERQ